MAKIRLIAGCMVLGFCSAANATEGDVYGGPTGGTDIRNAYLPAVSGFYGAVADVPGVSTYYTGNAGTPSKAITRLNLTYDITAASLLYVYPFKLLGGTLASDVQFSYDPYVRFSINNMTQRVSGWGDMYADIAKWSYYFGTPQASRSGSHPLPYGLTIQPAFSMIFPIGTYNTHQFTTPGHNDYFVIPNFAVSYLTQPNLIGDGLELSARLFYDHALPNPLTHYKSGDVLDLDFAVSERDGRFQYGIAGFGAVQVGRDIEDGETVPVDGKYFDIFKLGPVAQYDFPRLGLAIKAKLELPIYSRNSTRGPQGVIVVALKL